MTYPGGKNGAGVYQAIINQMPPHRTYVEAFAGSAAIFRKKRPAAHSILIDKGFQPLPECRCSQVTSVQADAIDHLQKLRLGPDDLVYADPPYVHATRTKKKIYEHEMSDADHRRLLAVLKSLDCMVAISGYRSDLYAEELTDWRVVTFQAKTRGGMATEYLWMNYPEPVVLHDHRYVGANWRDRDAIKRKAQRWGDRLVDLDPDQQRGILSHLMERRDIAPLFRAMVDACSIVSNADAIPTPETARVPVVTSETTLPADQKFSPWGWGVRLFKTLKGTDDVGTTETERRRDLPLQRPAMRPDG